MANPAQRTKGSHCLYKKLDQRGTNEIFIFSKFTCTDSSEIDRSSYYEWDTASYWILKSKNQWKPIHQVHFKTDKKQLCCCCHHFSVYINLNPGITFKTDVNFIAKNTYMANFVPRRQKHGDILRKNVQTFRSIELLCHDLWCIWHVRSYHDWQQTCQIA